MCIYNICYCLKAVCLFQTTKNVVYEANKGVLKRANAMLMSVQGMATRLLAIGLRTELSSRLVTRGWGKVLLPSRCPGIFFDKTDFRLKMSEIDSDGTFSDSDGSWEDESDVFYYIVARRHQGEIHVIFQEKFPSPH